VFTLQSSTQNEINKIKLLTGKLVIENEVMENEIKMKLKLKQIIVSTLQLQTKHKNKIKVI